MLNKDSRTKFQTTDSMFYLNKSGKNNYHYTTSTNFSQRRPYENGPYLAHRIKETAPEIEEDVFEMFDDQKNLKNSAIP